MTSVSGHAANPGKGISGVRYATASSGYYAFQIIGKVIATDPVGGVVGRASNRKKAQRQAGPRSQQAQTQQAQTQQAMHLLVSDLQAIIRDGDERTEREAAARRIWSGGAEPVPARAPRWREGSLGDRFFDGDHLAETRNAPSLATAQVPDAAVIAADPGHWNVAASALIRAVVFDGLALDHPAVLALLDVLAPIAESELAYNKAADAWMNRPGALWDDDQDFPELDGPVFLIGACALVDAIWAAVGEDPLTDVLGILVPALDAAVPGLDGQAAADALIAALATEYRCEQPGDAEVLDRIKHHGGNALENLVAAGAVRPADVLPAGLSLLSALARLCRSDEASILAP
jgi:hypothetical protein